MSTCFSSVNACRLRAALLDPTGVPLPGADSIYVTDALIKADIGLTIETGARLTQKTGCGAICVTFEEVDKVLGSTIGLELCHLDAELIGMLTAARVLTDGDVAVGLDMPNESAAAPDGVSIEIWTQAWDGDEQAIHPVSGELAYYRFGFPRVKSVPGNFTLENGILRFPVTGKGNSNSNFYDGPANDWPDAPITGPYAWFLDDASGLPDAACGYQTLIAS